MKKTTLSALVIVAGTLALASAVRAEETSATTKTPTETNQPMMGNDSQGMQGMMGMMNMMSQMQQMMESCNQMMKASNERHDKQNTPKDKDRHG